MEGAAYLHLNVTNMVTIWIMGAAGVALYGLVRNLKSNNNG